MDDNLSAMLKDVLGDPEAMEKLKGMASSLMGSGAPSQPSSATADTPVSKPTSSIERKAGNDERIALIAALRPYLSEDRRKTADTLVRLLKVIKLSDIGKLLNS